MDGAMDAVHADQWRAHLAACPACGRYDRVLRSGLKFLRAQSHVAPADDFVLRLQHRLLNEDQRMRPVTSLAGASLAVAAMLAFAAWIPVVMLSQGSEPSAVVAESVSTVATEIAWHREGAVEAQTSTHIHMARRLAWAPTSNGHVIETKYSPVVFESPTAPPSYARPYSFGTD
jgi:hypothetical protein